MRSAAPAAGTRPGQEQQPFIAGSHLHAAARALQRCPEPRPRPPRRTWSPAARPRCRWCCCCCSPPVSAASRELRRGLGRSGQPSERRGEAHLPSREAAGPLRPGEPPVRCRAARSCRAGGPLTRPPFTLKLHVSSSGSPDCSPHVGQPAARPPRRRAGTHRRRCSRRHGAAAPAERGGRSE